MMPTRTEYAHQQNFLAGIRRRSKTTNRQVPSWMREGEWAFPFMHGFDYVGDLPLISEASIYEPG